jgi:hypothetical protein
VLAGYCSDLNDWWEQETVWRYYRGEDSLRPFTFTCPAGFTLTRRARGRVPCSDDRP